jgi:CBS-domain-containing membrane protein
VPLKEVVKVNSDVVKAIEVMKKHKVDGVLVVESEVKVVGVVCKGNIVGEPARTAMMRKELCSSLCVESENVKLQLSFSGILFPFYFILYNSLQNAR